MNVVPFCCFQANDIKSVWSFVEDDLLPFVFSKEWYNSKEDLLEGFTDEKSLYIIGMPRMRQLRTKPGTYCFVLIQDILFVKVHMNRKFFLCRYKRSPLKYTISKFETFGVKIGDVTGVQSYAFCPEKWSSNRAAKRPKCHVM